MCPHIARARAPKTPNTILFHHRHHHHHQHHQALALILKPSRDIGVGSLNSPAIKTRENLLTGSTSRAFSLSLIRILSPKLTP
jgi:hypothetical protein